MKKILFVCLLILITNAIWALSLKVYVNKSKIDFNDSLTLTFESDANFEPTNQKKFVEITNNFEVIGTNNLQTFSIINGKTNRQIKKIYTLVPKAIGIFEIPSFTIQNQKSNKITIQVINNLPNNNNSGVNYFANVTLTPGNVYEDQVFFFKVEIYSFFPIHEISKPNIVVDNFTFDLIKSYERMQVFDNKNYYVVELIFSAYAEKAGEYKIPRNTFTILTNEQNIASIFLTLNNLKRVRINTEELKITIKPKVYFDELWLPANDLQAKITYSKPITNWKVGDVINAQITLQAQGMQNFLANQIDLYPKNIAQLNLYREDQNISSDFINNNFQIKLEQQINIIPNEEGFVSINGRKIKWYDVDENKIKYLEIPGNTILIKSKKPNANLPSATSTPKNNIKNNDLNIEKKEIEQTPKQSLLEKLEDLLFWAVLTLVFLVILIVLYFIWKKLKLKFANNFKEEKSFQEMMLMIENDKYIEFYDDYITWLKFITWLNKLDFKEFKTKIEKEDISTSIQEFIILIKKMKYSKSSLTDNERIQVDNLDKPLLIREFKTLRKKTMNQVKKKTSHNNTQLQKLYP